MNIIIAGVGKIGRTLAKQLAAEGHNLTLIDEKNRVLEGTVESFDATFPPMEKKWMPSQEEFYIYSHSSVVR